MICVSCGKTFIASNKEKFCFECSSYMKLNLETSLLESEIEQTQMEIDNLCKELRSIMDGLK